MDNLDVILEVLSKLGEVISSPYELPSLPTLFDFLFMKSVIYVGIFPFLSFSRHLLVFWVFNLLSSSYVFVYFLSLLYREEFRLPKLVFTRFDWESFLSLPSEVQF